MWKIAGGWRMPVALGVNFKDETWTR